MERHATRGRRFSCASRRFEPPDVPRVGLILIGTWNEFLFDVILGNHNAVTVTRLITNVSALPSRPNSEDSLPANLLAAGAMVAVIPCLLLVLAFHRRIITGLTEGLVKG